MHTLHVTHTYTSCSTIKTRDQRVLGAMLLSLAHLLSCGPPGQISMLLIGNSASRGQVGGCFIWGVVGLDKDRR